MTSGEQRCNDHLQVDLFYQLRRKKNFLDLAQILDPLPKAWPGVDGMLCGQKKMEGIS
ncbi:hypothetical protein KDH_22310 [Dictyobacter sp. S3.2.2.5]|uniref:Uncharacterized protein n=1 Tax=Dictyobacter halimunensis TaxID=3026934 RepID=A0ABQ6FSJ1_9CHLR|nr:hypothetical protein KDH_22310 [Dictyobacter sp. S3.2.2.5]